MRIVLDRGFRLRAHKLFEKYQFEVGILDDSAYRRPLRGARGKKGADVITSFAGGPARKKSQELSGKSVAQISAELREKTGINYLTAPFENPKSEDILKFTKAFFMGVFGNTSKRRMENLVQAIIRNPILRGDYGHNSPLTKRIKGFDRPFIDTAQFFKSIKARLLKKVV